MLILSSFDNLSFNSSNVFWVVFANASPLFLISTFSLRFLSSSACSSASFFIFSISESDNFVEPVMLIDCSLPVPLSCAETFKIPFTSISNVTSICGIPFGAGNIPSRWKRPRLLLSIAIGLSPCNTFISTLGWLSAAVENILLFFVGTVVFLGISSVATPPNVSMLKVNGVTSRRTISLSISPDKIPAWIAAPIATHSIGSTSRFGFFPNISSTFFFTIGILVVPPTRTTWSISDDFSFASFNACLHGSSVLSTIEPIISSNLALLILISKCLGTSPITVIYGRLISVWSVEDNSIFAFSAASINLWSDFGSLRRSILFFFIKSSAR